MPQRENAIQKHYAGRRWCQQSHFRTQELELRGNDGVWAAGSYSVTVKDKTIQGNCKRGLVILGTRKIWDSSLAAIGMLWAKRQGNRQFRAYHDLVFERFWRRELDIEDPEVITAVLSEVDADTTGFRNYLAGEGQIEHDAIRDSAEASGVFGVPTLIVNGELFWGREHLVDIRERLARRARGNAVRAAPSS